ncbi:PrsW family intramembrane metalloprotease [Lactiplantibacillus daowaiensis]|uniref:PrsW family intramembrane metalloprotease n=1 Tax=Lactiplantibacillus daowaiensis TaxID=2559918 RepID=A0ABW1S2Z7_9LACO|nr:PrsW family glutamic-type intramembrane protease [Lactiplantibacillus daowaiensis]
MGAPKQPRSHQTHRFLDDTTKEINEWTGEAKAVEIHPLQMFSEVFDRHTKDDADELFTAGTQATTPPLAEVSDAPVKPWLFSRVLMVLLITFSLLLLLFYAFKNERALPGLLVMGSLTVPFALLIYFFEINVFKNVSILSVLEVFLIGGVASMVATMLLYSLIPTSNGTDIWSALLIGLIEETGKLLIIAWFINHLQLNYIFNGMLIGAAVGAGFAVFETAGYGMDYGLVVLIIRSWQAVGTHTLWSAMVGAAVVFAKDDYRPLTTQTVLRPKFMRFYFMAVALHALWDWHLPLAWLDVFYIHQLVLIGLAWVVIFVLIDSGLREVRTLRQAGIPAEEHIFLPVPKA